MASRRTPLAKEALRKAGQFDAESVKRVDLSSASLVSLSGLEDFSGLVALCVDDNKVRFKQLARLLHRHTICITVDVTQ